MCCSGQSDLLRPLHGSSSVCCEDLFSGSDGTATRSKCTRGEREKWREGGRIRLVLLNITQFYTNCYRTYCSTYVLFYTFFYVIFFTLVTCHSCFLFCVIISTCVYPFFSPFFLSVCLSVCLSLSFHTYISIPHLHSLLPSLFFPFPPPPSFFLSYFLFLSCAHDRYSSSCAMH